MGLRRCILIILSALKQETMKKTNRFSTVISRTVRQSALVTLFISMTCTLFLSRGARTASILAALNYDLLASVGIVLLLTTYGCMSRSILIWLSLFLAAFIVILVLDFCGEDRLLEEMRLACAVLFTLPHCVLLTRSVFFDIREMFSVRGRVSSWEHVNYAIRMTYLAYFFALVAVYASFNYSGNGPVAGYVVFLLAGFVLFILVLLRSVGSEQMPASMVEEEPEQSVPHEPKETGNYQVIYDKLRNYMEESRPFLNGNCQLDDIAQALCSNRSYISRVISACSGMNFPRFINSYRVRYSMELYKQDNKLKVTEMALRSGFHSAVSYNMAFKVCTGQTPGEWCMEYRDRITRGQMAKKRAQLPSTPSESASRDV